MATLKKRKAKDGTVTWQAVIRRTGYLCMAHRIVNLSTELNS
jgi:hypothetical protein